MKKIVITGKSCSGKSTLVSVLSEKHGIEQDVLFTTRPPRSYEKNGIDYRFISEETFDELQEAGMFAEVRSYNAKFGFCRYASEIWDMYNPKTVIILTPDGIRQVKQKGIDVYVVYIDTPKEVCIQRGYSRADKETDPAKRELLKAEILRRAEADEEDFAGLLADMVLDGTRSPEENAKSILKALGLG